jgi:hypothetical protein
MKTEIQTPTTPNFIHVQIGKDQSNTVPISDFSEEELREIGKKWTEDLVVSARRRKTNIL